MTLHWWMHWFWVTALLIVTASSAKAYASSQSHDIHGVPADAETDGTHAEREGRALYFSKPQAAPTKSAVAANATDKNQTDKTIADNKPNTTTDTPVQVAHPSVIQWTPVNDTDLVNVTTVEVKNITNNNITKIVNDTTLTDVANATAASNSTLGTKTRNSTGIDVKDDASAEEAVERKIETLSLETTLVQTRLPPNVESSRRVIDQGDAGMDTGAIAGISFAALVLAALAGSTAFVLYRRRYLNKPQTLNDKCSNPDSSGYLDDSTVRDNSEEMYSLDNDSFLNSLEAMTIQNYWTDTVKHTKL